MTSTNLKIETIPILLVEDNPLDIEIIKRSLTKGVISNPMYIAKDGQEAIDLLRRHPAWPWVLILDIHLPKVDGMEVLNEANLINPEIVVIMLTGNASIKTAIQSLRRAVAFDYLQKSKDDLSELAETVRLALDKQWLRLQTSLTIRGDESDRTIDMIKVQEVFGLSHREIDVIKCICRGNTNKEVAESLFISEQTVKTHLKKIYQKTEVHNRTTLISKILTFTDIGERPLSKGGHP